MYAARSVRFKEKSVSMVTAVYVSFTVINGDWYWTTLGNPEQTMSC